MAHAHTLTDEHSDGRRRPAEAMPRHHLRRLSLAPATLSDLMHVAGMVYADSEEAVQTGYESGWKPHERSTEQWSAMAALMTPAEG